MFYYILLIFLRLFFESIIRTLLRESFTKTHKRTPAPASISPVFFFFSFFVRVE